MDRSIIVIAHDIRSAHNVGAILRTCDGMGVTKVYLTGYTPYPKKADDARLPHLAEKIDKQIQKTSLDAQHYIMWEKGAAEITTLLGFISDRRKDGYVIAGLEQASGSKILQDYQPPRKIVLILGSEVDGMPQELISAVDVILEIPMLGKKESLNVVHAASMALFHLRFSA